MGELMYHLPSWLIAAILFVSMAAAIELGYRVGRSSDYTAEPSRTHINAMQASLLGVLALLLGFTFSLALQRHDGRSAAVVDEANAIGTATLRAQLLPESVREKARADLRAYLDLRVRAGDVSLAREDERRALVAQSQVHAKALWDGALRAAAENPNPVTTGLFIQALNEMFDAQGRREAALARHVPEVVLFLLYGTFLMTGVIVGYAAGVAGHRASFITYIMVALIVLLVFIIVDLDRPRRGLIEVDQQSLIELRAALR